MQENVHNSDLFIKCQFFFLISLAREEIMVWSQMDLEKKNLSFSTNRRRFSMIENTLRVDGGR